jgi:hypothetical protein
MTLTCSPYCAWQRPSHVLVEAVLRAADLALEEDVSNNRHDMDYSDDLGDGGTQVTIEPRHLQQMLIKLLLDF